MHQRLNSTVQESLPPQRDLAAIQLDFDRDVLVLPALCGQQHDPRPLLHARLDPAAPGERPQLPSAAASSSTFGATRMAPTSAQVGVCSTQYVPLFRAHYTRSFEQLARRPRQVLLLHNTGTLSALPPRARGAARRMMDHAGTRYFPKFLRELRAIETDADVQKAAEHRMAAANVQFDQLQREVAGMGLALETLAARLRSRDDMRAMRRGDDYSPRAIDLMLAQIAELAATAIKGRGAPGLPATRQELAHSYVFRVSVCTYLSFVQRIEARTGTVGGFMNEPQKARNDMVDAQYAAVGLYFDGLRTHDRRAAAMYQTARVMMDTIFL